MRGFNDFPAGGLVSGFLLEDSSPHNYCVDVLQQGSKYNGFNLLTAVLR